ncbi:MAG: ImmA/IrrE family metallo-endopeptidase [Lachnospiraceae bacterium]|jgi:hypothetical protein|nr:ImmA/IrrE family metallo-endopeptidase [Lachnospiraceae bacterium]
MLYDDLLIKFGDSNPNLTIKEADLPVNKGRIKGNKIAIRRTLSTKEKGCTLAEELGHHYTTVGNILDQSDSGNRKQELKARTWAYNELVGLDGIVSAYKHGYNELPEMAEYLDVTEEFLIEAIQRYRSKYGTSTKMDGYMIYFEPVLIVAEVAKNLA